MRLLIVYYSHSGNNEKLSLYLKEKLQCAIHKITEIKKRKTISILFDFLFRRNTKLSVSNVTLSDFDTIIFVSPVWGCKIATPIRMFIEKEKAQIRKYGFISLCNGEYGQKEKIMNELLTVSQKTPIVSSELSINKLLPVEQQNKIKYTFNYKVSNDDIHCFADEIEEFLKKVQGCDEVV